MTKGKNRGIFHVERSDFRQAIVDFDRAIELEPNLALAYANRGRAHAELGDFEQAIADLTKALSLTTDPGLRAQLEKILDGIIAELSGEVRDRFKMRVSVPAQAVPYSLQQADQT